MTARKLSDVEVDGEVAANELDTWFRLASPEERAGPMPLEAMRASAELRRLSLRIARVEKDLATERRLHRDTEKRAEVFKVERDVARRERDERASRELGYSESQFRPRKVDFTAAFHEGLRKAAAGEMD